MNSWSLEVWNQQLGKLGGSIPYFGYCSTFLISLSTLSNPNLWNTNSFNYNPNLSTNEIHNHSFQLIEVTDDSFLTSNIRPMGVLSQPLHPSPKHILPNSWELTTASVHTERITESIHRQLEEHLKANPISHWFKSIDTKTGEMVFEENPYAQPFEETFIFWKVGENPLGSVWRIFLLTDILVSCE